MGSAETAMSVTLAELLERQTPVAWFEGVAIVQALCAVLVDLGDKASVPELRDIAIAPEGNLELLGAGPAGQPAVHRAGRVLTALVDQQHMPVPLRLLALAAVSPEPGYTSLRDLSTALEYFERPNRSEVVAGVCARAEQLPAAASGDRPAPLRVLEEPSPPPTVIPGRRKRRSVLAAGIAAGLLAAVASAWWLWDRPEGHWLRSGSHQVSRAVTAATDTVVSVAGGGLRAVKERLGTTTAEAAPPAPPAVSAPGAGRPQRRRAAALPSKPVGTTGRRPGQVVLSTLFAAAPRDPWQPAGLFLWADDLVVAVPMYGDSAVYTKSDPLVVPPELVRPRLPKLPPPGIRLEDLPRLELLVSISGEVESVKLMSPGAGVHPAMMLSAVKNWRFQPATRAGQPVRYRHVMWLTR